MTKRCFGSADILLPDFNTTDAKKWAVIACDQFTSEPHYWKAVENEVGNAPSTLNIMLPEVYLNETEKRIPQINKKMEEYLRDLLISHPGSMIYTERVQSDKDVRRGIVMAIDLEAYDFKKGSKSLIRATEATVIERIPPRVAIRRDASIELPHVMLLIDDPKRTVIEKLNADNCPNIAYDTDLMQNGGHIVGRFLSEDAKSAVSLALDALITPEEMRARYGAEGLEPLLFAVGDGNHSLATAKTIYEEIKAKTPYGIFLDINLPDIDGLDLLNDIKQQNSEIKIIMLTADSSDETKNKAVKYGADAYITKPFLPEHVEMVLRTIQGIGMENLM